MSSFTNLQRAGSEDLWLTIFAYGLQLYLDFSAYVDMARGTALLLGWYLPPNFDFPYFSASIADFWRRWHMTLQRDGADTRLRLSADPPENSCRPSVDPLFRTVADLYGAGALGVILTGMGQDGLLGARRLHERQGRIVVQDEATSVVWGMPGAVARAGLAHRIVPLQEMSGEILKHVSSVGRRRATVA